VREERLEAERAAKRAKPAPAPKPAPVAKGPSKNAKQQAKRLEAEIEEAERTLRALEAELADPAAWNDPRAAEKSTRRHAKAKEALDALYARWETVAS
jgi:ATP-binding cassette subfamily F protein 3